MIDLRNNPITNIVMIDGPLVTLECVCGRHFTVSDGEFESSRCEVCLETAENVKPLTELQVASLAGYMCENVLAEYPHKLNRL